MASQAHESCEKVIKTIKTSQLDFVLQETPYSAFITIRKRFCKDFNKSLATKSFVAEDDLKSEIEGLRNTIREKDVEIEESRNESFILQQRLEKAEKDTFKHFEDANQKIARLSE